jgi:hypothetical protein
VRRFLFVAWALAGIFATSSELKQSAFCASLAFRWTSYSLSRTGDRSGEAEGSCAFFFFDFGLRAVALPLAGAIVGVELRNGRFFWTCAFEVFEAVAVSLSARQCFVLSIVGPTM